MLGEDLQPALDGYLEEAESEAGTLARSALLEYYDANWNTRGHEITDDPADNPYFRLIETARTLGKRVFALDAAAEFILFRYGEFPLGATVLLFLAVNRSFYGFLRRRRGWWFAVRAIPVHALYYVYSSAAFVWTWIRRKLG